MLIVPVFICHFSSPTIKNGLCVCQPRRQVARNKMEERVARRRERGPAARNEKKDGREREWDSDESQAHSGEWSRTSMFELIQQPCLCCVLCKCSAMMKQRGRSFNGLTLLVWVEHPHSSCLLTAMCCAFSDLYNTTSSIGIEVKRQNNLIWHYLKM